MNVDDRLRQSLHRSVEAVAASAELLGRIERGLRPARGRRPLVIAAGAAAALGVFAVAFLLLVHQFGAESARQPSPSPPQFRTSIVQWSGDRFAGFWKVYYRITNQGTAPAGAAVACFLRDASGDTSEPGEGTVRYVAPHRVVEGLVVVKGFKFEPAGGQCTAQPLPPVSPPPPPPPVAPHFVPTDIAFWDTEHGVAVGAIRSRPCRDRCTGAIAITADGGERWTVTFRGSQYDWVTVLGTTDAWVSRNALPTIASSTQRTAGGNGVPFRMTEASRTRSFSHRHLDGRSTERVNAAFLRQTMGVEPGPRPATPAPIRASR